MKTTHPSRPASPKATTSRGSAMVTAIILSFTMVMITGSMLDYTLSERRGNERNRMIQRARNMSENISLYVAEQITVKLYRLRSTQPIAFMDGTNAVAMPPTDILQTINKNYAVGDTTMEVRAGLTGASGLVFIDPVANPTNANAGLQVNTARVPIVSKATAYLEAIGDITSYTQHDLALDFLPLFQFAAFYNMDMEMYPGEEMRIAGPVHVNGSLNARTGSGGEIWFLDRVSMTGGYYADAGRLGPWYRSDGTKQPTSANPQGGHEPVNFRNRVGTATTSIRNGTATTSVWRDHKYGQATENITSQNNFRTFTQNTYGVNLRTSVHGVTDLLLPSVSEYSVTDDPSTPTEDERDNGRQVIEAPNSSDSAGLVETKFGRSAGLYIVVNPDDEDRSGRLPDGSSVLMRARSYRCWLNTKNGDGTHTITEVVLPGQPSYGALNATPNRLPNQYRVNTAIGHNQILRTIKGGGQDFADTGYNFDSLPATTGIQAPTLAAFADAYFYDIRRADGNTGAGSQSATGTSRSTVPYVPRPVVKVDFDMTRFRMAVERSMNSTIASSIYHPSLPKDAATWNPSIYNPGAARANTNMGLALGPDNTFSIIPTLESSVFALEQSQAAAYAPQTLTITSTSRTNADPIVNYDGRIKIEASYLHDGTYVTHYLSTSNESVVNYTPPPGVTHLRISQYAAGGAPLLDEQIVPVVADVAPLGVTCGGGFATGRFVIETATTAIPVFPTAWTPAWTTAYTSIGDEVSTTFYPAAGVTGIRVTQYQPGGTSTEVQKTIIPVVKASLTNDKYIIPGTDFSGAVTDMRVFVGGVDDTANWTFARATTSGTVVTTLGGGRFNNRVTATGMAAAATTGTVNITASRPGFANITRTFTLVKQSSLAAPANSPAVTTYTVGIVRSADPYRIYFTDGSPVVTDSLVSTVTNRRPWYDGVTVYIHSVDAELRADGADADTDPDRIDSGVRLWNGRGPVVSLDGAVFPARTGFSFCTNDTAYIIGHFNADGTINSNTSSTTAAGGYSARYPDTAAERLCSVMADSVTILSQPVFENNAPYEQIDGWADALSANAIANTNAAWATTQPGGGNSSDGTNNDIIAAALPNLSRPGTTAGDRDTKFSAVTTEVSTALLVGIIPTNHDARQVTDKAPFAGPNGQSSGGFHNFPRLLEDWGGISLYIRGSMVAMFESRVAIEPWNLSIYNPPARNWGLHESLRNVNHDLPLEPILIGARRLGFKELTKAQYETMKTTIEALPR